MKEDPPYNPPPQAEKWRRLANSRELKSSERSDYGKAVLEGVRIQQRQALARATPGSRASSASGTAHSDGASILAAIRRSNATSFDTACKGPTVPRTPDQLRQAYEAAMQEKRAAMGKAP